MNEPKTTGAIAQPSAPPAIIARKPGGDLKGLVEKFRHSGESITDIELHKLVEFYRALVPSLAIMGADFALAKNEAMRDLMRLEDWACRRRAKGA